MLNKIICSLFGHRDEEYERDTVYHNGGGWHEVVYSWLCRRCGRVREYER